MEEGEKLLPLECMLSMDIVPITRFTLKPLKIKKP
jgi:hypothetical protein